jgi:programmed cell death 6-interacting protein
MDSLKAEEKEDDSFRTRYGTERWTRSSSSEMSTALKQRGERLGAFLKQAEESDATVRSKLLEWEDTITLLSGEKDKVESFIPSARNAKLSPESVAASRSVRSVLNELSRTDVRRGRMIEDLRFRMQNDDIRIPPRGRSNLDDLILEKSSGKEISDPSEFEDVFAERLASYYASNRTQHADDKSETLSLRAKLRTVNTTFIKSRKTDTSLEERERALQSLEAGYSMFLEIAQNLDEGRKFYNELAKMLGRWREEINGYVYQRRKEARDLEGYDALRG